MEQYEEKIQIIKDNVPKVHAAGYEVGHQTGYSEGYAAGEQSAGGGEPATAITLIDTATGTKYTLQVTDGRLTMEEVIE